MEPTLFDELPALPYAGTSGWSGSNTSQQRAITNDATGATRDNQCSTINHLYRAANSGLTWKELADITGWHHGTASGVLSVLHKEQRIYRLTETRNRCKVYVHPDFVNGREYDMQGRKPKECPNCGHVL